MSTIVDHNDSEALEVTQEVSIAIPDATEYQQAGGVEQPLEYPLQHVLHLHKVLCGVPKFPHKSRSVASWHRNIVAMHSKTISPCCVDTH